MSAIGFVLACLAAVAIGTGGAYAIDRLDGGWSPRVRHALASAAFWVTAGLPAILPLLTHPWRPASAVYPLANGWLPEVVPAQTWLLRAATVSSALLGLCAFAGAVVFGHRFLGSLRTSRLLRGAGAQVGLPMLIGYVRPRVVMPRATVLAFDPPVVRAIRRHELAHARRLDNWRLLAEHAAMAIMPWCWPLRRLHALILAAREELCDLQALRGADDVTRAGYAEAVLASLRHASRVGAMVPTVSTMAGPAGAARRRLLAILGGEGGPERPGFLARASAAAALGLACVAICVAGVGTGQCEALAGMRGTVLHFESRPGQGRDVFHVTAMGVRDGDVEQALHGDLHVTFHRETSGEWRVASLPLVAAH
ncbi:hypothetical protein FIV34_09760 [Luteibacter pinisoli]|uniref:Peptidase M56 domain-containing protein n=1 Tax=Luteibacter pinisoli TaxID=2589080 RepID=A0A4Y5Z2Z6_9GAMM|nr:M56 family metallopeptidase [Luteibacter pinisoli]QDE39467.1 hypothetical protein FIV34_09760 [Luteibacter pinisoli]